MSTASDFLTNDHRECDALWAKVEAAADGGDLAATRAAFVAFDKSMQRHFEFEEKTLFPAIEQATGMSGFGPTAVMRSEHEQMRRILATMTTALESGDTGSLLDHGDTLLMVIQQHNVKEERILYPIADARVGGEWAALRAGWVE
ncbi:MAG: hemerythrin domain-containing protein [Deltaproteobacteria bacterium]|nr:hemerythrin domain-containing protein [Deltaproteobacteria bacterium]